MIETGNIMEEENTLKKVLQNNIELRKENIELKKENKQLKDENAKLKYELKITKNALYSTTRKLKSLEEKFEKYKEEETIRIERIVKEATEKVVKALTAEHKKEVQQLKNKISSYERILNIDSSNSGLPSSKNPIGKKVIQNNREKSELKKGGQINHTQHKLEPFKDDEITKIVEHKLDCCPECGSQLQETNIVLSDIIDIEINITKTRNKIHNYRCKKCKKNITANNDLPRGTSYGCNVNALICSLLNEANTPFNKVASVITGLTNNEINVSEGYLCKQQRKNVALLDPFIKELRKHIVTLNYMYWDDTVAKIGLEKPIENYDKIDLEYLQKIHDEGKDSKYRNGIIRFYGDDKWAYLVGHRKKDTDGIDDDGILSALPKSCTVMHDHLLLNYNEKYSFTNAECNEHVRRYLKGNMDMFPDHKWAEQMRKLLIDVKIERDKLIDEKVEQFTEERLNEISKEYDEIITLAYEENKKIDLAFIDNKSKELCLINRLNEYKENHLLFLSDFNISFTNNTSEKALRQTKRKLAVSFMFKNANRMKDYATMLSYLETCLRHGITRYDAAKRLVSNNPYTIEELKKIDEAQAQHLRTV